MSQKDKDRNNIKIAVIAIIVAFGGGVLTGHHSNPHTHDENATAELVQVVATDERRGANAECKISVTPGDERQVSVIPFSQNPKAANVILLKSGADLKNVQCGSTQWEMVKKIDRDGKWWVAKK